MITCVCLNPSIDRTVVLKDFTYGGMNRAVSSQTDASGKGINVAAALAQLGARAALTGFLYRDNMRAHKTLLKKYGVENECIVCEGAARLNVKVLDRSTGAVTEINDSGVPADEALLSAFMERVKALAQKSDYLALTGSRPPGCPRDFYARVIRETGARVFLDAEGETLRFGLEAGPFLVKPNRYELELLLGRQVHTRAQIAQAAGECVRMGAKYAVVSLGAQGALMTDGARTLFAPAVPANAVSTVGAGDCMLAGLIYGLLQHGTMEGMLRCGVAAGAAGVLTAGTEPPRKADFEEFLKQTEIEWQ